MHELYYLGFSLFPGIGPAKFSILVDVFGSPKAVWSAQEEKLREVVGEKLARELVAFRNEINLKDEYEKCVQLGIKLVTFEDKEYPERLKQIPKAPFLLYVKGNVSILSSVKTIGIVGTRKITPYGKHVTDMLTRDLVGAGFVTVSGLALGVDAIVHIATVQSGGETIAVLGCGVDCCTPANNQKVYEAILENGGAIVSTLPRGMEANQGSFPARNAIIAGISQAIVVTEGAADSGSLITANDAKKIGRPVFAVPGPITSSLSQGANGLIKEGAIAVTGAKDILDSLGIIASGKSQVPNSKKQIGGTKEEQEILDILETGPLHFDEIVRRIKRDSKTIGSLLSLMELKGQIKSIADSKYSL